MRIRWLLVIPLLMPLISCQEKNEFTITWKNIDGKVLEVDYNVPRGSKPAYDRSTPTYGPIREEGATSGTSYYFSGWDQELTEVKEDKTYTATYSTKPNYDVKWISDDGRTLYHLPYVIKDNKPIYNKEFPHKEHTGNVYYAFNGWKDIETGEEQHVIFSDTVYQAQYDETTENSDYDCDGLLDYLDPDYKSSHNSVTYEYEQNDRGQFDFAIDYYDYFINQNPERYSKDVAKFIAALNIDAFYTGHITFPHEACDFDDKKYIYERLGCDNIEEFFVEKNDEPNDVGGAILAHHKVLAGSSKMHEINKDYNIFFLTIKASREDNIPLWKSDLDIGSNDPSYTQMTGEHPLWTNKDYHKGLFISSNRVKDKIGEYLAKFQNLENKILVISGHSRGATTANYIAKQYQGDINYNKIFAYTFGSPNYYFGNESVYAPYIFNFLNDDDLIEHVPFSYFNGKLFGNNIRFSIKDKYTGQYSKFTSHSYESPKNIEEFIRSDVKPIIPNRDSTYKLDESASRCLGLVDISLLRSTAEKTYYDNLALLNKYGLSGASGGSSPYHLYYDGDKTVVGYNCPYALYVIIFKIAEAGHADVSDLLDLLKIFNNYDAIYNGLIDKLGLDINDPMPKASLPHRMSTYYVMVDAYTPNP
ncbi:MAG: lipase family protein [Bacilli bacterium]|nr:lipase family protein [Bacilli bacterium]